MMPPTFGAQVWLHLFASVTPVTHATGVLAFVALPAVTHWQQSAAASTGFFVSGVRESHALSASSGPAKRSARTSVGRRMAISFVDG